MGCKHIGFFLGNIGSKGGAERTFSIIANKLSDFYEIMAVSYYYSPSSAYNLNNKIKVECILDKGELQRERCILKPKHIKKIRQLGKKLDIAVIVSSASALGILAMLGLKNLKIITWEQTSLTNMMYMTSKRKFCQLISIAFSDVFLCLSKENVKIAKNKYRFFAPKVTYIYNAIDEDILVRNEICDVSKKRIITLARVDRVKGLDLLLEVARIVLKKFPDWEWNVYGQKDDKAYWWEIQDKINKYGITNRLHFYDPVDDVVSVLKNSSIYVMTSRYEGLPMSLLEAKALRVPSVAFDCKTGPSEIILSGINGDLISCYDVNGMSKKLMNLMGSIELRREYCEHAYDNLEKFRQNRIFEEWVEIIEGIK